MESLLAGGGLFVILNLVVIFMLLWAILGTYDNVKRIRKLLEAEISSRNGKDAFWLSPRTVTSIFVNGLLVE